MKNKAIVRYLTKQDLIDFYGQAPAYSVRGVAVEQDGKVIGLGGVYFDRTGYIAFSDMRDELKKNKRAIIQAGRMCLEIFKRIGVPVVSISQKEFATAEAFNKHFGGKKVGENFVWHF